jgi:transcriptional regulator with XRE-family HTH domain
MDPIVGILRRERAIQGHTVRSLSTLAGIGSSAPISEWENGHHEPTLTNLRRWANALGLDVALVVMPAPTDATPTAGDKP